MNPQLATARDKARRRQQALRRMCRGPDGRLTQDARLITAYLRKACLPPTGIFHLDPVRGGIDPLAMARAAGRREVFDLLATMLDLTIDERHNPEGDA